MTAPDKPGNPRRRRLSAAVGVAPLSGRSDDERTPKTSGTDSSTGHSVDDSPSVGPGAGPAESLSRRPEADPGSSEEPRPTPRWRWASAAVAAVAAAIVLVLAILDLTLFVHHQNQPSASAERDQLLAQAKTATAALMSYDYRHLDLDLSKNLPNLTDSFAADYRKSLTQDIKPTAIAQKVVAVGQVTGAGVESVSSDGTSATVLVFGLRATTSTASTTAQTDPERFELTLIDKQGRWLVDRVASA
ncbi:hypothetical protein M6D93_15495 [Jatrophihabitans telluris]|uniref:Mce-associated membrane protein n=1 Tax=Jatrophihabitans telluris TaxID=2038343 RepID=A0ABY4QVV3_9ACTN|nr:hypothetical protein [Jatrophihabitans telluris]UQX87695.1 hypothetical protein M6D93_15495 [Jatrophihabitans telluris]